MDTFDCIIRGSGSGIGIAKVLHMMVLELQ